VAEVVSWDLTDGTEVSHENIGQGSRSSNRAPSECFLNVTRLEHQRNLEIKKI
jgi:hypothetical protein